MDWISVKDRLPEPGIEILIYTDEIWIGYYRPNVWWGRRLGYDHDSEQVEVTHWQPLPPSPAP